MRTQLTVCLAFRLDSYNIQLRHLLQPDALLFGGSLLYFQVAAANFCFVNH